MIGIDTNILVYAFDVSEGVKREKAKILIKEIATGKEQGAISNQVLAELTRALLHKIKKPLPKEIVQKILYGLTRTDNWEVFTYTSETISKIINSSYKDYWNALLAQTLKEHGVTEIYTENVKDFEGLGITAINPFSVTI